MSIFDEDEMSCEYCGHTGMILDGDFDVACPVCGAEYSLINEDEEDDETGHTDWYNEYNELDSRTETPDDDQ